MRDEGPDEQTTGAHKGSASMWPAAACSIAAATNIIIGASRQDHAHGWRNESFAGGVLIVGAMALFPPILQTIRAKFPQIKPRWVPVVYAITLLPFATVISQPLAPTPAEQVQLRAIAVRQSKDLLAHGQLDQAADGLVRYQSDHDVSVNQLAGEISARKKADASAQAQASVPTKASSPAVVAPAVPAVNEPLQTAGSAYAERIKTYWLPEVEALPNTAPEDSDTYGKVMTHLDGLLQDAADGADLQLTSNEKASRRELVHALAKKQIVLFPALRRRYVAALRARLFRDDVDVSVSGRGATTLREVGPTYSLNANIEDDAQASRAAMLRLRFRQSEYNWSRYMHDDYVYTLQSPSDDAVMVWDIGADNWKPIG